MTSATVAGGGAECCAEASAMIYSLGDSITLLGIRSHHQAEAARACVASTVGIRGDDAIGSRGDVPRSAGDADVRCTCCLRGQWCAGLGDTAGLFSSAAVWRG